MIRRIGGHTLGFEEMPTIIGYASVAGKKEGEGPLGEKIDLICEDPMLGVPLNGDSKIVPVEAHLFIGEGLVSQLVHGIAGVGDNFTEKNLPVGIDRIDHQVQQPLGFRFKLFLFHKSYLPFRNAY